MRKKKIVRVKAPLQVAKVVVKKPKKTEPKPIVDIARSIGIKKKYLELYGTYKAKILLEGAIVRKTKKTGKYIIVTSITPSPMGEGKTVTTIGLSMAFNQLKKKSIACIPQPSLSGVFGSKGAGTGAGLAQVFPQKDINLHFTGDTHAVGYAHNLCAAYLDNSVHKGNSFNLKLDSASWGRVLDINDRSLRNINIGLGSKADGVSRKTGFELTTSSEIMGILTLAESLKDLRQKIGKIVLGFTEKGKPVTCEDIKVAGAMTAVLKDAIKPNLVQTQEGTACFVHAGSIGNISLGMSSVIADKVALGLCDYVVAETGFGADMGAEKFFDIKCRTSGIRPDAAVLVCSVRGLKMHSGDFDITAEKPVPREAFRENISAVERGLSNLEKQIENVRTFGVPVIVCINRFSTDTEKEIMAIKRKAIDLGATTVAVSDIYASGGGGGLELAKAVIEACKTKHGFRFLYPLDLPLKDKIKRIAKTTYGAKEIKFSDEANKKMLELKKLKLDNFPVCMAKTQSSLSHSPKRKGRPHGFKLPIEDLELYHGAGYITVFCGDINTIPGLPKVPRGTKIDVNEEGKIIGLL